MQEILVTCVRYNFKSCKFISLSCRCNFELFCLLSWCLSILHTAANLNLCKNLCYVREGSIAAGSVVYCNLLVTNYWLQVHVRSGQINSFVAFTFSPIISYPVPSHERFYILYHCHKIASRQFRK